jgi:AbrB family looped-hinge helix DNA binding protein
MLNNLICTKNIEKRRFSGESLPREKEAEFTVYVRREGRVTIPKEVRDALKIKEGSLVECRISKVRT